MSDDLEQLLSKADLLCRSGELAAAISLYDKAVLVKPESTELHYRLGEAYLGLDQCIMALQCFRRAAKLDPSFPRIQRRIGDAALKIENWEVAIESYQLEQQRDDDTDLWCNLGIALTRIGKLEKAVEALNRAVQLSPGNHLALHHLGDANFLLEHWDTAIKAYQAALQVNPNSVWSYVNLGRCFRNLGQLKEASSSFRAALAIDSGFLEASFYLGMLLVDQGGGGVADGIKCLKRVCAASGFDQTMRRQAEDLLSRCSSGEGSTSKSNNGPGSSPVSVGEATLPREVGIVVPARNSARWLPGMLLSLEAQTFKPTRIVVVNDGQDSQTRELVLRDYPQVEIVDCEVGNGRSGNPARNVGLRHLRDLPYLVFADADDYLPPDYLAKMFKAIESDSRAAAAYARVNFCNQEESDIRWATEFSADYLNRTNLAQSSALIRTDALLQVGGWPELPPSCEDLHPMDDWALWRRLVGHGWRMVLADTDYYYRKHGEGICSLRRRNAQLFRWHHCIDQTFDFVTLAIPFSGRDSAWRVLDRVLSQDFPAERIELYFLDNSLEASFGKKLREWLSLYGERYASYRYERYLRGPNTIGNEPDKPLPGEVSQSPALKGAPHGKLLGNEINHQVAALWNRIGRRVQTSLVWCLEDDVVPTAETLSRLVSLIDSGTEGVSAFYKSRVLKDRAVAWKYENLEPPTKVTHLSAGVGVTPVGGFGLGCALVRKTVFSDRAARSTGDAQGYDCNLFVDVARSGGICKLDWDLQVEHLGA